MTPTFQRAYGDQLEYVGNQQYYIAFNFENFARDYGESYLKEDREYVFGTEKINSILKEDRDYFEDQDFAQLIENTSQITPNFPPLIITDCTQIIRFFELLLYDGWIDVQDVITILRELSTKKDNGIKKEFFEKSIFLSTFA